MTAARAAARRRFPRLARSGSRSRTGARKASHQRIGVVGRASAFGQYFFYGTDLSNHVQYIGQRAQPRHLPADRELRCSGARRSTRATTTTSSPRPSSGRRDRGAAREPLDRQGQERQGGDPVRARRACTRSRARSTRRPARSSASRGAHVSFGDYLQGSIELIAVAAAHGLRRRAAARPPAARLVGRLGPPRRGGPRPLAAGGDRSSWSGWSASTGPAGCCSAALVAGLGIGFALARRRGRGRRSGRRRSRRSRSAIAVAAAFLVAAHWAMPTQTGLDIGMYLPNTTWHNAPFAARFVQDHQVGRAPLHRGRST